MLKRALSFGLALALLLTGVVCMPAQAAGLTKPERYEAALEELKYFLNDMGSMPLSDLSAMFDNLGAYQMSMPLTYYTMVLSSIENGNYDQVFYLTDILKQNTKFCKFLEEDGELGTLEDLELYAQGRRAEMNGEHLKAVEYYQQCMWYRDSMDRVIDLQQSMLEAKYQEALSWYKRGTYEGYQRAYELFLTLGDYKETQAYLQKANVLRVTPTPPPTPTPMPQTLSLELQQALQNRLQSSCAAEYVFCLQRDGTIQACPNLKKANIPADIQHAAAELTEWSNIANLCTNNFNEFVGLKKNGAVVYSSPGEGRKFFYDLNTWKDVVDVTLHNNGVAGLKKDGTVLFTEHYQFDASAWRGIVDIEAGWNHLVGLKSDGTVVATGDNRYGQCNTSGWCNIIAVSVDADLTVGLREDGTVVAVGVGQNDASDWRNIVQIDTNGLSIAGLRSDGRVVIVGDAGPNGVLPYNVNSWRNIVAIDMGLNCIVGIRQDGTVVAASHGNYDYPEVKKWRNAVAAFADDNANVYGILRDGSVVYATRYPESYLYDFSSWDLFD